MIFQEIYPNPGNNLAVSNEDTSGLKNWYPKVAGFRLNFVIGNGITTQVPSDSHTNSADRLLLKFIRSQSDLIITTGKTARNENLRASVLAPMLIITQSSEPLSIPALNDNYGLPVYVTQWLETEYENVSALAMGGFQESVPDFCSSFCKMNSFSNLVLETGPTTAREFATAGLIAEVNLSTTNFTELDDARAAAEVFLASINFSSQNLKQILKFESTWFFRFGAQ